MYRRASGIVSRFFGSLGDAGALEATGAALGGGGAGADPGGAGGAGGGEGCALHAARTKMADAGTRERKA